MVHPQQLQAAESGPVAKLEADGSHAVKAEPQEDPLPCRPHAAAAATPLAVTKTEASPSSALPVDDLFAAVAAAQAAEAGGMPPISCPSLVGSGEHVGNAVKTDSEPPPIQLHMVSHRKYAPLGITVGERLRWSPQLHTRFVEVVSQLGGPSVAKPKEIVDVMNIPGLSINHVKSHLQKYRLQESGQRRSSKRSGMGGAGSSSSGGDVSPRHKQRKRKGDTLPHVSRPHVQHSPAPDLQGLLAAAGLPQSPAMNGRATTPPGTLVSPVPMLGRITSFQQRSSPMPLHPIPSRPLVPNKSLPDGDALGGLADLALDTQDSMPRQPTPTPSQHQSPLDAIRHMVGLNGAASEPHAAAPAVVASAPAHAAPQQQQQSQQQQQLATQAVQRRLMESLQQSRVLPAFAPSFVVAGHAQARQAETASAEQQGLGAGLIKLRSLLNLIEHGSGEEQQGVKQEAAAAGTDGSAQVGQPPSPQSVQRAELLLQPALVALVTQQREIQALLQQQAQTQLQLQAMIALFQASADGLAGSPAVDILLRAHRGSQASQSSQHTPSPAAQAALGPTPTPGMAAALPPALKGPSPSSGGLLPSLATLASRPTALPFQRAPAPAGPFSSTLSGSTPDLTALAAAINAAAAGKPGALPPSAHTGNDSPNSILEQLHALDQLQQLRQLVAASAPQQPA